MSSILAPSLSSCAVIQKERTENKCFSTRNMPTTLTPIIKKNDDRPSRRHAAAPCAAALQQRGRRAAAAARVGIGDGPALPGALGAGDGHRARVYAPEAGVALTRGVARAGARAAERDGGGRADGGDRRRGCGCREGGSGGGFHDDGVPDGAHALPPNERDDDPLHPHALSAAREHHGFGPEDETRAAADLAVHRRVSARDPLALQRSLRTLRDLHRLAFALGAVVALDLLMATTCSYVSVVSQLVVHFAWFEASLLLIKTLQLGTKVAFHVFDIGNSIEFGSEKGEFYLLILQTTLSGCYLVQLVFYYLYIISVDQFRVSFLDFILIINVKNATVQLLENLKKVKMYHQIVIDLDQLFPDATQDELDAVSDDVCVICLKPMDTQAKKLHCGHLFHRFCLRQCLQKASIGDAFTGLDNNFNQVTAEIGMETGGGAHAHANTSLRCPICRKHVHSGKPEAPQQPPVVHPAEARANDTAVAAIHGEHEDATAAPVAAETQPAFGPEQPSVEPETEEVIRFSTEFLSRWIPFPNFSFEIVRHRSGDGQGANGTTPFVVTPEMVQQVWEVFPQYSSESISADLMRTRSPERTIERILNGSFEAQQSAHDDESEDLGDIAQTIGDIDDDLRWSVSTLWSNLWQAGDQQPPRSPRQARGATMVDRNGNVAEHIAFPPEPAARNHIFPNGAAEAETLLRRLQRWREDER
ncbi:zinc finger protein, partial [Globisporangium splendens]